MENYNRMQTFKIKTRDAMDKFIEEELEQPIAYEKLRQKEKLRKPDKKRHSNKWDRRRENMGK
uniref:Uncharacterized protein n=1 Tax=viral metagenome TaxID=1070528 RepID=A0A6H1ZDE0_9ZZZZ